MRRAPHENVATVLVEPCALADLELELMVLDLRVWPIRTAPNCLDGARTEFQVRRRLVEAHREAPDRVEYLLLLGYVDWFGDRRDEAANWFRQARARLPGRHWVDLFLGRPAGGLPV